MLADKGPARGNLADDRHHQQKAGNDQRRLAGGIGWIDHREIHPRADQHEKHRGEQRHDRQNRLLNGAVVLGAAENQTGSEGAQSSLQTDRRRRETTDGQDHKGGHQHFPRGLQLVDQPVKGGRRRTAKANGRHNEHGSSSDQLHDRADLQGAPASQGHHDGQDHDAEDVIENGSADHDLTFTGFEVSQLTKHAGGNADAGGRHGSTGKNRRNRIHVKNRHQTPGAKSEGQHHTSDGHGEGLCADSNQFLQLTFQTGEKQQGIETQLSHRLQRGETLAVNLRNHFRGDIDQPADQPHQPLTELHLGFRRHQQMQS